MERFFKNTPEVQPASLKSEDYLSKAIQEASRVEIPAEYRDREGSLLVSPNGPKSKLENELHWKIVRTSAFKEWFGDWENDAESASKVVDGNGEPLLTYHATNHDIKKLTPDSGSHFLTLGKGVYLTPDASLADLYGDRFYSCFLNIKNLVPESGSKVPFLRFAKTLFYSLNRLKNTALSSDFEEKEYLKKELYGNKIQFSVLHQENIMIVPSDASNPAKKAREKHPAHKSK